MRSMYLKNIYKSIKALLFIGGALMLVCCDGSGRANSGVEDEKSMEGVLTESSRNLTVVMSENGRPSYIFKAPKVEGYTLAMDPYREFKEGVDIVTFKDDSLRQKDATLTANYALYYEDRKLWETMGNVEVKKTDGKELYSEQLFWNSQTKRIYSNVDTKIYDKETGDVYFGDGFESDELMEDWSFRNLKGRMKMEVKQRRVEESNGSEEPNEVANEATSVN